MGQYHKVVNLDKRQYLHPHQLGDGLKIWEQVASGPGGTASALLALLAVSNGRGGGDLQPSELVGSWGGDRIAVIGDYAEPTDLPPEFDAEHIYSACDEHDEDCDVPESQHYRNISLGVAALLGRELDMTYQGDGWRDRVYNDDNQSDTKTALAPDMVLG